MQQFEINSKPIHQLNNGESMANLPILLHNAILNWETKKRIEGNKFFQAYEELSAMLNIHPQTLRHYTNISNPKYPPVNILISICNILEDYTMWDYLTEALSSK